MHGTAPDHPLQRPHGMLDKAVEIAQHEYETRLNETKQAHALEEAAALAQAAATRERDIASVLAHAAAEKQEATTALEAVHAKAVAQVSQPLAQC